MAAGFAGSERVGADGHPTATLQQAPLVLAQSPPHAGVLAGLERPAQALLGDRATPADRLGLLDLQESRAGRPDREEQLRVLIAAGGMVAPVHGGYAPCSVALEMRRSSYVRTARPAQSCRPASGTRKPATGPGSRSLVNAFTNCRDVKR